MLATKDTRITFRTNSQLRKAAGEILEDLQIDLSTALNIFLAQVVKQKTLPLDFSNAREKELEELYQVLREDIAYREQRQSLTSTADMLQMVAEDSPPYLLNKHDKN